MDEKMYYKTASFFSYSSQKEESRRMRRSPTLGEDVLWQAIRGKSTGVKFRRQHVVGEYIVDFVCLDRKLIIEVDGEYHNTTQQQVLDQQRTSFLEALGFCVLRFTNEEVLFDINRVIDVIRTHIH